MICVGDCDIYYFKDKDRKSDGKSGIYGEHEHKEAETSWVSLEQDQRELEIERTDNFA